MNNFWDRFNEVMGRGKWGSFTDWVNGLLGTDYSVVEVVVYSLGWTVLLMTVLLVVVYLKIGLRTKNRPGATGRFATDEEMEEYSVLPVGKWYAKYFLIYFFGAIMVWAAAAYVVPFVDTPTLPLMFGVSAAFATFVALYLYDYKEYFLGSGFFVLGSKNTLWGKKRYVLPMKRRQEGILVNGPTGAGKTTALVEPQVISDAHGNMSNFLVDVKTNECLVDIVAPAWAANGKRVVHFDPWDKKSNFSMNPLLECKGQIDDPDTYRKVSVLVDAIFNAHTAEFGLDNSAGYFDNQERELLWGLISALLASDPSVRNLPTLYELTKRPLVEIFAFLNNVNSPFVFKNLQWFAGLNEQKKNDFLSGLRVKLSFFGRPDIRDKFVNNDFSLSEIYQEPTLFIVRAPLSESGAMTLPSILARMSFLEHFKYAPQMVKKGLRCFYYLDEFGSLRIPKVSSLATTIRSSNGGLSILLHDRADLLGQSRRMPGESSAESLDSSLRTQIVLPASHQMTCRHYSERLGLTFFKEAEKSRGIFSFLNYRFRELVKEAPLMTMDEIQNMDEFDELVFVPNRRGVKMRQERSYQDKLYQMYKDVPFNVFEPDMKKDRLSLGTIEESYFEHTEDLDTLLEMMKNRQFSEGGVDYEGNTVRQGEATPMQLDDVELERDFVKGGFESDPQYNEFVEDLPTFDIDRDHDDLNRV